ncbi:sialic acid-binding Ig-like lectin 5 isoform X2 [Girardinichthys multiradiatus]|uniref:sialic acid-binding Ig-like lectin 5 isoform X2 n=1 Tax=Girardinichthys multiradiatus TaxID=208333 RepID=UPI001FAB8558|nr:sialic acid-binding Ig-like lectin 5 isoform X2 [Girardinichthys multiradiatus]
MFIFIWLIVSLSTNKGALGEEKYCQITDYCVTLTNNTAEAGRCAVIPCSFTTPFKPKHIIWYKCDRIKCSDSHTVFHSDKNNENVQVGFKGRVSLLEPDVTQKNCSIIINDLNESDFGSYQLRVEGYKSHEKFTYTVKRTNLSLSDLNQKPKVMIPPLTEGQQNSLTCTAPDFCSGLPPKITWMWGGKEEIESNFPGNITVSLETETLTNFTQRHRSILTFNPSAKYHNRKITCKVSFKGDTTTEETGTLNVNYSRKPQIYGKTTVMEGDDLNLTCSVDSVPASVIKWTKSGMESINILRKADNSTVMYPQENSGNVSFSIINVTAKEAGRYICTATYQNVNMTEEIHVKVTYTRLPKIIGNPNIKEGDVLNLTCIVDSFPPSLITWTTHSASINPHNRTSFLNSTGSATLVILNMTVEDSAEYVCTATHMNNTVTEYVDIKVTWFPKVLNGSGCLVRSDVLTCVCISEGFPLPTIKWPMLNNHTRYSVINMVSNHTVNSTVTIPIKTHGNISVDCFSSNENGEAKEKLRVQQDWPKNEEHTTTLRKSSTLEIVIAFSTGLLLSAIICCLFMKVYRKKEKKSGNLDQSLEMVSLLMSNGQAVQGDQLHRGAQKGPLAAAPEATSGSKELVYASIDFSLLSRIPRKLVKSSESTNTEYAEIKTNMEKGADPGEMMIEEDSEMKNFVEEVKDEAEEPVYSNAEDFINES